MLMAKISNEIIINWICEVCDEIKLIKYNKIRRNKAN